MLYLLLPPPFSRIREQSLFAFSCGNKTMEVKNEQQDEDITFSNTDANGKNMHILIL